MTTIDEGPAAIACTVPLCRWDARGTLHGAEEPLCRPPVPGPGGCLIEVDDPEGCPVRGWAKPPHYDEGRDRECPGTTWYAVGDLDAPCDTCGGRTGWLVAGGITPA